MNKRKAIKVLKKQIDKIDTLTDDNEHLWYNQTCTYIIEFFNDDSYEYSYIKQFTFKDINAYPIGQKGTSKEQLLKNLKTYLNNCIEIINDKGLYKSLRTNFLSKIPDWLLALILTTIVSISFLFGKYTSDVQNIKLEIENDTFKKSSTSSANSYTNKTKDSTNYPKN